MNLTDKDEILIEALRRDGRKPLSVLARQMGVSRAAIQQRLTKLEDGGAIDGYTVVLSDQYLKNRVRALIMIKFPPNMRAQVEYELEGMQELTALYSISGMFDMAGVLSAASMAKLDQIIDAIGTLEGIEQTMSSIILSTKIMR